MREMSEGKTLHSRVSFVNGMFVFADITCPFCVFYVRGTEIFETKAAALSSLQSSLEDCQRYRFETPLALILSASFYQVIISHLPWNIMSRLCRGSGSACW